MAKDSRGQQIDIELAEEVAEGVYANLAIISHSNSEFVLDFVRLLPALPKARVKSRVIMTPQHAKRLLMAMQDNMAKYEAQFGEIVVHHDFPGPDTLNFGGPMGMA